MKAVLKEEDYDFNIIKERNIELYSSIEQNGIKEKDYILAKKKCVNNKESLNDKKESNSIKENPKILGEKINLTFINDYGQKIQIIIGLNNTFKDALIIFCNKTGISPSIIGRDIFFIHSGLKLNWEDNKTLGQMGIWNGNTIIVVDNSNALGS